MAVKAFFFKSGTTWDYGTFESDGTTVKEELTFPSGQYRAKWQTVNLVVQLTIYNKNNVGEIFPFRSIPITEVASDLIGTPYASKAAFLSANSEFFASNVLQTGAATSAKQDLQATALKQDKALGKKVFIVTGATKTSMPAGYYAYYGTSWYEGGIIASCEKTVGVTVSANTDEGILGVAVPLGMGFPFEHPVTSVTQTAATDVICYWLELITV